MEVFVKNFTKIIISALLSATLCLNDLPAVAAADNTSQESSKITAILSENIRLEYISTEYNGEEQKPRVIVTSDGEQLIEDTDFTVRYSTNCTNAGKKTIIITGKGNYSGHFSTTYMI